MPANIGLRLVFGTLGLFGVIVIGGFLALFTGAVAVFIYGAIWG